MMKTSAIIRIMIWSLVALILTGVLIVGIRGGWSADGWGITIGGSSYYPHADRYTVGNGEITADSLSALEVNWVSGGIDLSVYDGETILLREDASRSLDEEDQMRYLFEDGKLTVQYSKSMRWSFFFIGSRPSKRLEISIPRTLAKDLRELSIDSTSAPINISGISASEIDLDNVSGDITMADMSCRQITIDNVSGRINADALTADRLNLNTVSGSFTVSGAIHGAKLDTVSGGLTIATSVLPTSLDVDTISGDVELTLPENDGFRCETDSVSGDFRTDFAMTEQDDVYTYQNGGNTFDFESVSGNIYVRRAQ